MAFDLEFLRKPGSSIGEQRYSSLVVRQEKKKKKKVPLDSLPRKQNFRLLQKWIEICHLRGTEKNNITDRGVEEKNLYPGGWAGDHFGTRVLNLYQNISLHLERDEN